MRIKLDLPSGGSFEYEREPMPEPRFRTVCRLVGGAIFAGAVLIAVKLIGGVALLAAGAILFLYGLYQIVKHDI